MIRQLLSRAICGTFVVLGATALMGCGSQPGASVGEANETGTVAVALATNVNGHTYRLSGGYVYISGASTSRYLYTYGDASTAVSTALPTGDYWSSLYSWSLERDDGPGKFAPVAATLLNPSNNFTIANGATTTLAYQFQTDGVLVTVGSGTLDVELQVNEVKPVCNPFGQECGSGYWCPPAGLTGRGLACFAEGSVPIGQSCSSPSACVPNSTCLDLGSGPVCTEVCPASSFGAACNSGGVCLRCRPDYGVCLPSGDGGVRSSAPASVCPPPMVDGGVPRYDGSY